MYKSEFLIYLFTYVVDFSGLIRLSPLYVRSCSIPDECYVPSVHFPQNFLRSMLYNTICQKLDYLQNYHSFL